EPPVYPPVHKARNGDAGPPHDPALPARGGWRAICGGVPVMRILLCCAAGMSTSLLVKKMQDAARARGVEAEIRSASLDEVARYLDQADVLLLGPQVRYKLAQLKKEGEARGIPVEVIRPEDYGRADGEKVLDFALQLL